MSGAADGYRIEPLRPQTFDELAPIMLDAFGDRVDTGYFRWKYMDNPSGPAIGNIARGADGEVAAFYGMIPETYRTPEGARRIYQSCDTMTHSRHRRRGLFQKLALATYAEARAADPSFFAFGFGGPTSTPGFLKMGWTIAFEVPFLFEPWPLCRLRAGSGGVDEVTPDDGGFLSLVAQSGEQHPYGIARTADFVAWRLSNPQRDYRILSADGAYAVFLEGPEFVFLFNYFETRKRAGRAILGELRRRVVRSRAKGLLTFCQEESAMYRQLRGNGFLRNRFGRGPASSLLPLITYGPCPWGEGGRNWSVTPFDHDSY